MFTTVNVRSDTDAGKTYMYCSCQYFVQLSPTLYVMTITGRRLGEVCTPKFRDIVGEILFGLRHPTRIPQTFRYFVLHSLDAGFQFFSDAGIHFLNTFGRRHAN